MKTITKVVGYPLMMAALFFYSQSTQCQNVTTPRKASPAAEISQTIGLSEITVNYSRPKLTSATGVDRSGQIWGQLVPYGFTTNFLGNQMPWRAGANENTVVSFSDAVKIEGKDLAAGTYGLHMAIYEDGKVTAEKENKLIFIDAYADWCGPCKWMVANTFTDSEVGDFFKNNFISVQIDMESDAGLEFDMEYYVDAYPTLLFLNPKGEVIKRYSGALDAKEFLGLGKRVIDPTSAISYQLKKQIDGSGLNEDLLSEYLLACIDENEEPNGNIVDTYLSILETKSKSDSKFIADYLIKSNDFEREVNNDLKDQYFSNLNTEALIEDDPFTIFYFFQQDLKAVSTLYFIENYAEIGAVWGEYVEEKLGLLIINATEEIKANTLKKEELYSFIKLYSEFNDIEYNELKLLVDEIINS